MRYPCLIAGFLLALLFLVALLTCRVIGLPVSNDAGQSQEQVRRLGKKGGVVGAVKEDRLVQKNRYDRQRRSRDCR